MELLVKILVCFLAGAGAGIGTGFAGMSAAAVIGPILMTFLGVPAYQAVVNMQKILQEKRYIPQEILSVEDF